MSRFLGIDFSGNHRMWRRGCRRSNVWISVVQKSASRFVLGDLRTVQELEGDQHPFERLVGVLKNGEFEAVGIDAPFSVPSTFVIPDYRSFLDRIGLMESKLDRPFPLACDFVKSVSGIDPPLDPPKPLRATELHWKEEGLHVRSTLWTGARGGAAMTAACLKLLHQAQRPIWPWAQGDRSLEVEAFPMAQLKQWRLPYEGYGGQDEHGQETRARIMEGIRGRIEFDKFDSQLRDSAGALDSVLCAFAAIAVKTSNVAVSTGPSWDSEGWIAVYT